MKSGAGGKSFSFVGFLVGLWSALLFFLTSLFSSEPVQRQAENYRLRSAGYNIRDDPNSSFFSRLFRAPQPRGGGGGGPNRPSDGGLPRPNIHTIPKSCNAGG